jgi:hypothetical protein
MSLAVRLLPFFLYAATAAAAGIRGSADYTVSSESIDSAGMTAAGGSYRNDGSLGGESCPAMTAGSARLNSGYIARLASPRGINLTTSAPGLPETTSLTATAWETLDDDTRARIAANAVVWNSTGPVTTSANGTITAAVVGIDTGAAIAADYAGFTTTLPLVVFNTLADNSGSYAGDGIGDDWQTTWFGTANPAASPDADPDGDGRNNAFEWAAMLDPTSATSRFSLTIRTVPGRPAVRELTYGPRNDGPVYQVQTSTTLANWLPLDSSIFADHGSYRTVTDPAATQPRKFYRVAVSRSLVEFTYALDGLDDSWQLAHFGIANTAAAPAADPDGDGQDNTFEAVAGLDPDNLASRFDLVISLVSGQPGQRKLEFGPLMPGRGYVVSASTDLHSWQPLPSSTTTDTGNRRTVIDLAATQPAKFYRVVVTAP